MKVLISGGPGSGCTSTAKIVGDAFNLSVLDSDSFFHKPTDPPFQEQYSCAERKRLLSEALESTQDWILSGSVATWGVELGAVNFGILLNTGGEERLRRLELRERELYGERIDPGGDLHTENIEFMAWAEEYETRSGSGRNITTDKDFLIQRCGYFIEIGHGQSLDEVASIVNRFLADFTKGITACDN